MSLSGLPLEGAFAPTRNLGLAASAVVFLHGYGASGDDLIDCADALSASLPDTVFYAPDAPDPCEISAFGYQWFSMEDYDPEAARRDPHALPRVLENFYDGVAAAAPLLDAYLDAVMTRHGLTPARVALVGFSQGTMMALHVGLRRAPAFAGIVGFSGALAGESRLLGEIAARPPVLLIHGDADPVVPFAAMTHAAHALAAVGVETRAHACRGIGHGIDDHGLFFARDFLFHRLGAPS